MYSLYPLVAYLDQSYFRCSEDNFVGESYLLCKIIRKVQKGQSVKLDEIFGDVKKLPLNREQRRKMPKNMDNPKEIKNVSQKASSLLIECFGSIESKLELRSSGWIFCKAEKGVKLRYKNEKEINILEDQIQIFYSKNQKLTIKDKELLYEDGKNKFKIDDSGYTFGNLEIPTFLNDILDFLGNDAMLLTSCGPSPFFLFNSGFFPLH